MAYRSHRSDDQLSLFREQSAPSPYRDPLQLQNVSIYRVTLIRESSIPIHDPRLRTSADAERLIRTYLQGVDREHFVVLLVNRKKEVIGINTVSVGSLSASIVSPREVFKPAILGNAAALICALTILRAIQNQAPKTVP